jgi:hypothetical protein
MEILKTWKKRRMIEVGKSEVISKKAKALQNPAALFV